MAALKRLVDRLAAERGLPDADMLALLACGDGDVLSHLFARARAAREAVYGRDVYIRGLIEFTNFCKNDCLYCGIRRSNARACRYRLTEEEILLCAEAGYRMGFRTVVLQGGEDPYFTDERLCRIVRALKAARPDRAVTLSVGERSRESYQKLFDAGADRYLLRHETATKAHYGRLHPPELSFERRMRCLADLKAIGYQVGCGFMVGSPWQTLADIARDLAFIRRFEPEMVGIGPFIPHRDTPFAQEPAGTLDLTLCLLSVIRLLLPGVLLPATTALGTIHPQGRELGILAGANVVMPNLSPEQVRENYALYDNKLCTGDEAAEHLAGLRKRLAAVGCQVAVHRGDAPLHPQN